MKAMDNISIRVQKKTKSKRKLPIMVSNSLKNIQTYNNIISESEQGKHIQGVCYFKGLLEVEGTFSVPKDMHLFFK
jgi:hypothetical protein